LTSGEDWAVERPSSERETDTTVRRIYAKTILNRHKKRDDWFLDDYSINPYQGCPFNCLYCYTRGSKYGLNLARTLSVKANAPELLERQLAARARKGQYGIIAIASQEAYPPAEKDLRMTRRLLKIIVRFRFPVMVATKSILIPRDLDVLGEIDRNAVLPQDLARDLRRGAIISFSFSTMDEKIARIFEPGAPPPKERLRAMAQCAKDGFLVGANLIPVLPFLSDSEELLEQMIRTAKEHGGSFALVGGLTLFGSGPSDCRTLYYRALEQHFPEVAQRCKALFGTSFAPPREYQEHLARMSETICAKHGIRSRILSPTRG